MSVLEKFKSIRVFVFDVDGVMTDGDVLVYETGEQVRRMNTRDGYSLQLAVKKGYRVIVISGGSSEGVRKRLEYLGIRDIFLQVHDKIKVLDEVGLGYITLGQSAVTLSGGEAQRVKLSTELSKRDTGKTFYILD